jgi:phosphate acetyltransferase
MITPERAFAPPSRKHEKYERLIAATESLQPLVAAVAHPCDETSLRGALEAAGARLIVPILVGPKDRIRTASEVLSLDLHAMPRTAKRRPRRRSSWCAPAGPRC